MQVQQLLLLQYVLSGTVVAFTLHPRNRYHVTMNRRPKNLFSNIHGETDVSIGIGVDDGSLSAVCAQNDNNDKNSNGLSAVSRREAFSILAATGTAVAMISQQQPSAALAMDDVNSIGDKDTLQEINIGRGIWTNQNQYNLSLASSLSVEIPTIFITYMTRFLINYDDTINSWWNDDIVFKYSRLDDVNSRDEYNQQLRNNFSSLAKSMEISLLNYLFDTKDVKTAINTSTIRLRFESLLALFMASYTIQNINNTNKEERMKQILILFSMLPPEYQPVNGLKDIASKLQMSYIKKNGGNQELLIKDFDQNVSRLLPTDVYYSFYDSSWNAFSITPSILSHLTNTADEELFGSIASKPLKRQRPNLSFDTYSLLGLCGATGCALTHTLVIPFDVVKTRLQTNPNQYKNLIDGVISISKEETGLNTFLLGSQATIAGYFWYGLSVYPCYSFSKWYLEHVIFDPSAAVVNMNLISLVSGAIAAVVASIGLTPVEAARIRTVAEPQVYRELGLIGTLQTIAAEDANLGWKSLYAGFPSLVTRQGKCLKATLFLNNLSHYV